MGDCESVFAWRDHRRRLGRPSHLSVFFRPLSFLPVLVRPSTDLDLLITVPTKRGATTRAFKSESKMKFMVEFRFKPGGKNEVLEAFELRGPNRNPGVAFRGAWVGTQSDVAFVLVESGDQSLVEKTAQSWTEHGEFRITPVIDV